MAVQVVLPLLGDIMESGTVATWLKGEGEVVAMGEPLYVVETDKISYEVEAAAGGRLHRVAAEGQALPVGGLVGWLLEDGEEAPGVTPVVTPSAPTPAAAPPSVEAGSPVRATPAARHLAREHDVDLAEVPGTGPGGRIVEADVLRFVHARERNDREAATAEPAGPRTTQIVPLRGKKGLVAQRMLQSVQQMAQLTLVEEVEMTAAARLREELAQPRDGQRGVRVSYNDLMIKASALALREHPLLNSTVRGDEVHLLDQINVGLAVDTPDGLVVPVVRDADRKSLQEIAAATAELVERARAGRLSLAEIAHGTFTVTALGMYGVEFFTPIVNPPQAAILGVGRLNKRLALVERAVKEVSILYLSLSFDHRVVDGAPAARFLRSIKGYLENPNKLKGDGPCSS